MRLPFRRPSRHTVGMRVLIVEDEVHLAEAISRGLVADGFEADIAHTGPDGLWRASEGSYAAIVLDILLPGLNGFALCRELRARGDRTPVIMLTAKQGEHDEAEGLDLGADDFLRKPFSFVVLVARLHALIRRAAGAPDGVITIGDLHVDTQRRQCHRADTEIALTARELDLLIALSRRHGGTATKSELLAEVWGFDFDGDHNIVEVYVRYLRKKIDKPFERASLQTIRTIGYRLVDDAPVNALVEA
jgi:DNA-binding response OmpR family regulator